jgi:DNA ligase (NAD+)
MSNSNLEQFLSNPYEFIESASLKDLIQIAKQADIAYYNNDEPIMSDEEYDMIRDRIKELEPNNSYLKTPAHQTISLTQTITDKQKAVLPYPMGSMNKLKPEDSEQIKTFSKIWPGPWIVSDKLDGVSALYILEPNKPSQLYTRGNGTIGTLITNLISLIKIAKPKVKVRTVVR